MAAALKLKNVFYDELRNEDDMHSVDELTVCLGGFNEHRVGTVNNWCSG